MQKYFRCHLRSVNLIEMRVSMFVEKDVALLLHRIFRALKFQRIATENYRAW